MLVDQFFASSAYVSVQSEKCISLGIVKHVQISTRLKGALFLGFHEEYDKVRSWPIMLN